MITIESILDVENHIDGMDAVVFDLDDTLYSEKDYVRSGFRAVSALFREAEAVERELWEAFERGEPAIDTVLQKHGWLLQKEAALHTYRFHKPEISLYDGVAELLLRIRKTKRLGILTDGRPEGQRAKLEALGLYGMADAIIITDELGGVEYRKPNDAAFRRMAEQLQTPYEKMAYVGDNPQKDFVAPEKLGMRSIEFHNIVGIYQK